MRSLVWFRRDLRVQDNSALYHACKNSPEGVIGIFLVAGKQWLSHDDADCKVKFWLDNLSELSSELQKLSIPLIIEPCDWFRQSAKQLVEAASEHQCDNLFFNREYEVNELERDLDVKRQFAKKNKTVYSYHDRIVVPPKEISTKDGRFYSVFTPYRKVWDKTAEEYAKVLPKPKAQKKLDINSSQIPETVTGFDFSKHRNDLWLAGEKEAKRRLKKFSSHIGNYDSARDIPAVNGTSLLSPYLAAGVISPRQCFAMAKTDSSDEGAKIWVSELTWRDFYAHVMVGFPRVSKHCPFKIQTDNIPWRHDESDFEAWQTGNTGYPIVDAGMRQLNQTGWMHNRLRMVTAMFLSKHLMIDWRWGEKYFMKHLIDGDLAANNGGWQWSASTGTDAVPYFRIFNPFSQSKRFDSEGKFIKKLCPELVDVPSSCLHDGVKLSGAISNVNAEYPSYVVDHKFARERVLNAFKS